VALDGRRMRALETTDWYQIVDAARGSIVARDAFAARYLPAVEAYLRARWRDNALLSLVDDAVQEVFVDLFRPAGALARADREKGGFRALLFGIARIAALRFESESVRRREAPAPSTVLRAWLPDEEAAARAYDRAWAQRMLAEARELMAARLQAHGERAPRWLELLELRYHDGLPIRDIARRWSVDAARLHHEFASARAAFRAALLATVARYHPGSTQDVEAECRQLLDLLG
jgi:RNA polymerase sigma factor (sigma-70 family)